MVKRYAKVPKYYSWQHVDRPFGFDLATYMSILDSSGVTVIGIVI